MRKSLWNTNNQSPPTVYFLIAKHLAIEEVSKEKSPNRISHSSIGTMRLWKNNIDKSTRRDATLNSIQIGRIDY